MQIEIQEVGCVWPKICISKELPVRWIFLVFKPNVEKQGSKKYQDKVRKWHL